MACVASRRPHRQERPEKRSGAAMRQGALTAPYAETRADEPNFIDEGRLPVVIADEHAILG